MLHKVVLSFYINIYFHIMFTHPLNLNKHFILKSILLDYMIELGYHYKYLIWDEEKVCLDKLSIKLFFLGYTLCSLPVLLQLIFFIK